MLLMLFLFLFLLLLLLLHLLLLLMLLLLLLLLLGLFILRQPLFPFECLGIISTVGIKILIIRMLDGSSGIRGIIIIVVAVTIAVAVAVATAIVNAVVIIFTSVGSSIRLVGGVEEGWIGEDGIRVESVAVN